jgi:hypothetical protein
MLDAAERELFRRDRTMVDRRKTGLVVPTIGAVEADRLICAFEAGNMEPAIEVVNRSAGMGTAPTTEEMGGIEEMLRQGKLDPSDDDWLMGAFGSILVERDQGDILIPMKEQGLDSPVVGEWMQTNMGIHLDDYVPFKQRLQRLLDRFEKRAA